MHNLNFSARHSILTIGEHFVGTERIMALEFPEVILHPCSYWGNCTPHKLCVIQKGIKCHKHDVQRVEGQKSLAPSLLAGITRVAVKRGNAELTTDGHARHSCG